jgi:hypothetical protein
MLSSYFSEGIEVLAELPTLAWACLNSNFGTALAGAAAGAIAGAWAAQLIASHGELRKAQLLEIRHTNAAINLVIGIVNSYVGMKRQFVLPMIAQMNKTRDRYDVYVAGRKKSGSPSVEPFHFTDELKIFSPPQIPIELLRDTLFDKINSPSVVFG